jgi:hypothetical protein
MRQILDRIYGAAAVAASFFAWFAERDDRFYCQADIRLIDHRVGFD